MKVTGEEEQRGLALKEALLRNQVRLKLPSWLAKLQSALGAHVSSQDFLSVEASGQLKQECIAELNSVRQVGCSTGSHSACEAWIAGLKDSWRLETIVDRGPAVLQYWTHDKWNMVEDCVGPLAQTAKGMRVAMFTSEDEVFGAVIVPADAVLNTVGQAIQFLHGDLWIVTEDLESCLSLEFNYQMCNGLYFADGVYELTAWGMLVPAC